ncbi:hypothetical protein BV898_17925 [Hypsibius exemplaris]|uniref:Uncharacterized protein n=1 Tax=Hypsibius exemplaris TaxID=2072580 RepID=A0A9X6NIT0_HYPEX|nr:hypothetical protein BV898_17925 [Hypsibius exemplaris]
MPSLRNFLARSGEYQQQDEISTTTTASVFSTVIPNDDRPLFGTAGMMGIFGAVLLTMALVVACGCHLVRHRPPKPVAAPRSPQDEYRYDYNQNSPASRETAAGSSNNPAHEADEMNDNSPPRPFREFVDAPPPYSSIFPTHPGAPDGSLKG